MDIYSLYLNFGNFTQIALAPNDSLAITVNILRIYFYSSNTNYPVYALWFTCSHILSDLLAF